MTSTTGPQAEAAAQNAGNAWDAGGTVSPWRGAAPELVIAAVMITAAAAAGYAMAGGRACPWWPSRRQRPRCWCCAPCCRN